MFFLFSFSLWALIIQTAPPAVGLEQRYIDVVTSPQTLSWVEKRQEIGKHTVTATAEVDGMGRVYKTANRITLLLTEHLSAVEQWLTYLMNAYDLAFAGRCVVTSIQHSTRLLVDMTADKKTKLGKTVSVTNAPIADAMKNATSTTAVLHFVSSGLAMGGGQDPAVHALFKQGVLKQGYDATLATLIGRTLLLASETAIVRIEAKDNSSQKSQYPSYVLANAAPMNCHDVSKWSENVDSVIAAIQAVLDQVSGHLTVFLGAHGCGIFGNDAKLVAKVYYSRLCEWLLTLSEADRGRLKIVFPIPTYSGQTDNYSLFRDLLL